MDSFSVLFIMTAFHQEQLRGTVSIHILNGDSFGFQTDGRTVFVLPVPLPGVSEDVLLLLFQKRKIRGIYCIFLRSVFYRSRFFLRCAGGSFFLHCGTAGFCCLFAYGRRLRCRFLFFRFLSAGEEGKREQEQGERGKRFSWIHLFHLTGLLFLPLL